jgi:tripartite-type tricarboxylate transporter receptor subunit TctC
LHDNGGVISSGNRAGVKKAICIFWTAVCITCAPCAARAQSYPTTHVRIITAAAGGGSDFAMRLIAVPLGAALGQQVIVENRGLLAADIAAKAPPDGHTLLLVGQTLWMLPFMRDNVAANVADFAPVTTVSETSNILVVHPAVPAKSVRALVDLARARPGDLNYAISGNGNSVHIAGELFRSMAHIRVVRINYKSASQALTELIAGHTQYMFGVPGSVMPHIKAGHLRALAITGAKSTPLMPGLPPVAQTLPGYEVASRLAMFVPAGTPAAIVERLNREIVRALNLPAVKEKFHESQIEVVGDSPQALAALIKAEIATMAKIITEAGIRAD